MPEPALIDDLLPGSDRLPRRSLEEIDTVVLHSTELPTLKDARSAAHVSEADGETTIVAAHFYIDRDGRIYRFIDEGRIASHTAGHNSKSIGIELVNCGRWPEWFESTRQEPTEPYPAEQISALKSLIKHLRERLPSLTHIARHSDLDQRLVGASDDSSRLVRRRIDPGPLFPWDDVVEFWRNAASDTPPAGENAP